MKDELVKADDFNVVIVDWAGGSLPLYTQATANTRLVGLEVAHFVNTLQVSVHSILMLHVKNLWDPKTVKQILIVLNSNEHPEIFKSICILSN